jgi:hypothetical protein
MTLLFGGYNGVPTYSPESIEGMAMKTRMNSFSTILFTYTVFHSLRQYQEKAGLALSYTKRFLVAAKKPIKINGIIFIIGRKNPLTWAH